MKALKKGFTLIELIVVIAILAILALLIVPQVTGYVTEANKAVAIANARTCYSEASANYAAGQSNLPTPSSTSTGCAIVAPTDGKSAPTEVTWTGSKYIGHAYASSTPTAVAK